MCMSGAHDWEPLHEGNPVRAMLNDKVYTYVYLNTWSEYQ